MYGFQKCFLSCDCFKALMHIVEVSENLGGFHRFFQLFTVWTIGTRLKEAINSSLVKDSLFKHFTNHFRSIFTFYFTSILHHLIHLTIFNASTLQITCVKTSHRCPKYFFLSFLLHTRKSTAAKNILIALWWNGNVDSLLFKCDLICLGTVFLRGTFASYFIFLADAYLAMRDENFTWRNY